MLGLENLMMITSLKYSIFDIAHPDSDGLPMAESDATRDYLIYSVEALDSYFQKYADVYVSGNLFIYYEHGNSKAVVAPDVLVVFDVEKKSVLPIEYGRNKVMYPILF